MTKLTLACGLALTLAVAACASTPPQSSAASAAPAAGTSAAPAGGTAVAQAAAKPKLICEEDKPTGSHLPQRICLTPEEVAARQKATRDRLEEMRSGQQATVMSGGAPPL